MKGYGSFNLSASDPLVGERVKKLIKRVGALRRWRKERKGMKDGGRRRKEE